MFKDYHTWLDQILQKLRGQKESFLFGDISVNGQYYLSIINVTDVILVIAKPHL